MSSNGSKKREEVQVPVISIDYVFLPVKPQEFEIEAGECSVLFVRHDQR